ncbi:lasso peptide biosynthesis PqqD family chaperone [Aquibacillus halophilus]|uniref:Lasso peptide biosynthesis PqqD family chaperone n=1 Tax=Aquibacillus halophilus TaxID=930132 RepID=A0A6A8DB27_9BACI|nr:lasso peptide biosynthesis PqqD family chaperone [Aquibacillus halophilus]MRH42714.1 lasso peptide biosynthesis PqqD family chaperone [Aquibacillus halophilus]
MIEHQAVSLNQIVKQGEGNIVSNMDGEKVMLSIHKGKYYNLGEMGGEIWEQIKDPTSVKELIESLLSQYDVEESECRDQVISFLGMLANEELIQLS